MFSSCRIHVEVVENQERDVEVVENQERDVEVVEKQESWGTKLGDEAGGRSWVTKLRPERRPLSVSLPLRIH